MNNQGVLRIGYQITGALLLLKHRKTLEEILEPLGYTVAWSEFNTRFGGRGSIKCWKHRFWQCGGCAFAFRLLARGLDFVYVASELSAPQAEGILVKEDSPIQTVTDLKGKKVAFGKGSSAHYLMLTALEKAGLKLRDIKPVFLQPSDARGAFERGSVDAWAIWDPYLADAENHGARVIADARGLPRQYDFIVGRRDYFQKYSSLQETIIKELRKVHEEIQKDKKHAAEKFSQNTGISQEVWERTLERRDYGVFDLTPEVMDAQQHIADAFLDAGLHRQRVSVKDAFLQDAILKESH